MKKFVNFYILFTIYSISIFSQEKFVRLVPGYGIYGVGNIINSSGEGLDLIERGINTNYLYSPIWTPIINQYGPIYRIPDFSLKSYTFDIQYGIKNQQYEYGIGLNYFELGFNLKLPTTYLNIDKIIKDQNTPNSLYPVTKDLKGYSVLAKVLQLEVFYNYYWFKYNQIIFLIGTGIGIGKGNLSYSGPYVNEIHGILQLGMLYQQKDYEIFFNVKNSAYTAKTGPSNLIDRRKVLVNPRRGEIIITSLQFGITFLLTTK